LPIAIVLAFLGGCVSDRALADRGRAVPENAKIRPRIDTQGYPSIGNSQRLAIFRDVVCSSLAALVERPSSATAEILGRSFERVAVRARELTAWAGSARASDPQGRLGDGRVAMSIGSPPVEAAITLLPTSEAAIQGLLAQVSAAVERIDLMIYGWEDDPTGREIAWALERAARRGVVVRLLIDRTGFLIHNPSAARGCPTFLDRLRCVPNVSVIEPGGALLRFDHRKLAVIDGRVAWTGGMILTEVARRSWENLAFLAEGPIAAQYAALFEERWRAQGGAAMGPIAGACPPAGRPPNAIVRLVRTDVGDRSLKGALYHAVDHARGHIYLENPYFSDELLAEKLVAARRRGVDVRVVLTLRGNVPTLNRYVVLTANRLLRGGVRVYLAPGMTHVKALSVDGCWCYLGTGNFDDLSLRNNREVGLSVASRGVTEALDRSLFFPDLARAEELTHLMPRPRHWAILGLLSFWF
jgi:phosphatidylserine/phosphatidylglycerophosphate/cardiolipin synthase-like enzyme